MRKNKSKFLALCLMLFIMCFTVITTSQSFAETTGDNFVYFRVNTAQEIPYKIGTELEFDATHSGLAQLTGGGGLSADNLGRKMTDGQYVEYSFDLEDSLTTAVIKLFGTLAADASGKVNAKYSTDGGLSYHDLSIAGRVYNTGTYFFNISAENALANSDKTFRLKIIAAGAEIKLASVYIGTLASEISGNEIVFDYFSEAHDIHLAGSDLAFVWFDNGVNPLYFILSGGSVTYYYDLPNDWLNAVWSYNRSADIGVTYSTDNIEFQALPSEWNSFIGTKLANNAENRFYLKFTALSANSIIDSIKLTKKTEPVIEELVYLPVVVENVNTELAENDNEVLFNLNTTAENSYKFFTENITFDSTHSGLAKLTGGGGLSNSDMGRMMGFGECLVYDFDMADTFTFGVLKLYGTLAAEVHSKVKVEYSIDEGQNYTVLTQRGSIYFTGSYFYDLNQSNVFSGTDKKFRIKLSSTGSIVLSKLSITKALADEITDTVTLNPFSDSYMKHLVGNNLEFIYFDNGINPLFFILGGGHATFYVDLPDAWTNAKWSVEGSGALNVTYSTDGSEFVNLPANWNGYLGTKLSENAENKFYLRFSADSNAINNNIKLEQSSEPIIIENPDVKKPGEGINLNQTIPADQSEIYFYVGTEEENLYKFENDEAAFESVNRGMAFDNANGGWLNTLPKNARRLDNGDYLVYDFDLADNLESAVIKIYGSKDLVLKVSTDSGETYAALSADFLPYDLGYHKYTVSTANALSKADNCFRLMIEADKTLYFNEIMVQEEETATVSESLNLVTHSYDFIKYLVSGADNYTYVGYNKNPYVFFVGADKHVTFKFNLTNDTDDITLLTTMLQNGANNVKLQISTDGTNYTDLLTSSGGGGTPPSNSVSIKSVLQQVDNNIVWVRLYSLSGQAFARGVSVGIPKTDETSGGFTAFGSDEAGYVIDVNNSLFQHIDVDTVIYRTINDGTGIVYKIDLTDSADRVKFDFYVKGAYDLKLSKDGINFLDGKYSSAQNMPDALQTFNVYDILEDNNNKVIYIKITAIDGNTYIKSFAFATVGVPSKPFTNAPDIDDDLEFDYSPDGTPDNFSIPNAPTEPDPVLINVAGEGCGSASTANLFFVLAISAAVFLKLKRS